MEWIVLLVATLFAVLGLGCLLLVVVGLPGTWIMIGLAVALEIFDGRYLSAADPVTFGTVFTPKGHVLQSPRYCFQIARGARQALF